MIKKILRKPYRKTLTKLTRKVLKKHKPHVVVVMGDGQTSIGREITYQVLKQKFPVRRNLESPEAEFSVPLTVLGYLKYPKNFLDWVYVTLKSFWIIKTGPSYKHFLVLELNFVDTEILTHWLKALKPETALITGSLPLDYSEFGIKKIVKISNTHPHDILKPFQMAANQIGRFYRIESENIEKAINNFTLPSSKIRYYMGKNNSVIIDSTHFQYPVKIKSVLELEMPDSETKQEGRKIIFTSIKEDIKKLRNTDWEINPANYEPESDDVIILRGNRDKRFSKFGYLFESKIPLI